MEQNRVLDTLIILQKNLSWYRNAETESGRDLSDREQKTIDSFNQWLDFNRRYVEGYYELQEKFP